MYEFFKMLFSEYESNMSITLYNIWHIFYLVLILGGAISLYFIFRNKSQKAKDTVIKAFAYLTIGLYIADFFIMPLSDSYDGISAWKLPFNICTLMAVFVPFVQFNPKFKPIKNVIVMLSMASSVMWMVYPGTALGGEPPFCYLIFQTFMYHGFLFAWSFLSVTLGDSKPHIKHCWKELIGILIILAWAAFGNAIFNYKYDWFFITGSSFPFFPKWSMPMVVVTLVFAVVVALYGIIHLIRFISGKIAQKKAQKTNTASVVDNNSSN